MDLGRFKLKVGQPVPCAFVVGTKNFSSLQTFDGAIIVSVKKGVYNDNFFRCN